MTQVAIKLTDELNDFVQATVEAGVFRNASEMVANALHALKAQEQEKLAALRADVAVGVEQARRGEFVEFDAETVIADGRKRLASASANSC